MPVSSAPSPHVIPVEQVAKLSRWGRVALVARASMRTVPWFVPGPMRARQLALADLLAIDVCSTLGMLAATGGRQLATAVAEAAANAAMAALAAPGRVPLLPTDQAAMLAGLTVEWAGASVPPDALDTGSVDNARGAFHDLQALLAMGMQERGYEYAVPANFFSLPLWPAPLPDLRAQIAQWEQVLAPFSLLESSQRFQACCAGHGVDWTEAQRRAEAWMRMTVPTDALPVAPPGPHQATPRPAVSAQLPAPHPTFASGIQAPAPAPAPATSAPASSAPSWQSPIPGTLARPSATELEGTARAIHADDPRRGGIGPLGDRRNVAEAFGRQAGVPFHRAAHHVVVRRKLAAFIAHAHNVVDAGAGVGARSRTPFGTASSSSSAAGFANAGRVLEEHGEDHAVVADDSAGRGWIRVDDPGPAARSGLDAQGHVADSRPVHVGQRLGVGGRVRRGGGVGDGSGTVWIPVSARAKTGALCARQTLGGGTQSARGIGRAIARRRSGRMPHGGFHRESGKGRRASLGGALGFAEDHVEVSGSGFRVADRCAGAAQTIRGRFPGRARRTLRATGRRRESASGFARAGGGASRHRILALERQQGGTRPRLRGVLGTVVA